MPLTLLSASVVPLKRRAAPVAMKAPPPCPPEAKAERAVQFSTREDVSVSDPEEKTPPP